MDVRDATIGAVRAVNRDARHWQLLALSGLFLISVYTTDFGARPMHLLSAFTGAICYLGKIPCSWRQIPCSPK